MVAEAAQALPRAVFTYGEVAHMTGLSIYAVRDAAKEGRIPVVYVAKKSPRVPAAWVEALREGRIHL